ncbi:3-oxoacyl-ACP reductase FabG [Christiangramia portivictoriae]|uniref:3-oxoacyl-ACP reductase FabG n=1 Tax=Christiangramia portivictoriae TaxID=326069 RepID=UPI0004125A88|nr:3-oxoacyl-ACP reductase FabG [Christiangramia portivictoriae]
MTKKRFALVTGGSRGIGKAICMALARDHQLNILLNYRSNDQAAQLVKQEIEALNLSCDLLKFDVANASEVSEMLSAWKTENKESSIEVLVNNAGISDDGLFIFMSKDSWNSVLETSLQGFYNVTQSVLKDMLRARNGRIINMVSLSGLKGNAGQVNYSAAKGAVIAATKALAQEIGKRKVTVNAVAPGFINTEMTEDFDAEKYKQLIPLNRFGDPEEVASLVSFLASDRSSYITGEVININGGLYS